MLRDLLDVHRDVRLAGHVAQVQDRLALVLLADELRVALNEEVASEHHDLYPVCVSDLAFAWRTTKRPCAF